MFRHKNSKEKPKYKKGEGLEEANLVFKGSITIFFLNNGTAVSLHFTCSLGGNGLGD